MKNIYLLFISSMLLCSCNEKAIVENSSQILAVKWKFSEHGKNEWHSAQVPGLVHLDLWENQLIEDPYFEQNEQKQRWIENKDWTYQTTFNLSETQLNAQNIELDFKGLDTYAKVFLNDSLILEANNMFRSWQVDIKEIAKAKDNRLQIDFTSPINQNKEKVLNYPHQLPSGNEAEDIPIKVSNFSRKAAYHFGWDWGPRFVSSGIWRPIQINSWDKARIVDVYTSTDKIENDTAYLSTELEIEVDREGEYLIRIDSLSIKKKLTFGVNLIKHSSKVSKPKLWWTNNLGKPTIYKQQIELFAHNQKIEEHENRFGIRTIELINQKDSIGTSFYFKLNGIPVFMKGANYIPQDLFLPRVKPDQYEKLISQAKKANMNMLRVWGGGIYEEDLFYDLCDENGILVWQDFMFAGSLYPNLQEFEDNVTSEVRENIKRLRQHPSIAIWCGNNEIEVAWKNWGWQEQYSLSSADSLAIWETYLNLFHAIIPNELELLKQNNYTPSSPLSNWGTAENFNHSSMHYWGVWHGKEPFENFEKNVGRFMVEYGFQSFPSYESLSKTIEDSNMRLNSEVMKSRQKSYIGNGLIKQHIEQYYDSAGNFQDFIQLSQKTQAKGLKIAIDAHITMQPHCMGSLFWQFNDCWPGPSWSVIDYYGNKKIAYDSVKTAFSNR